MILLFMLKLIDFILTMLMFMADEVVQSLFGWLSKNTDLLREKLNGEELDDDHDDADAVDGV